jgi:cell volume regulation protein A
MATLGVVVTGTVIAVIAAALGVERAHAALIGAIVSSTDAAAVFSVLRGSGIQLRRRVGVTLELESGLNDPMAVILTVACTRFVLDGHTPTDVAAWAWLLVDVVRELGIGVAAGFALGVAARFLLARVRLAAGGLYPVVTIAIALTAYAVPTLLHGSGFIAVYIVAVIIGNAELPFRAGILRVHDAVAWMAQVGMFLVLGLLVIPQMLLEEAVLGSVLGLALAFIARPLAAVLCLAPFRYPPKEIGYIAWVGLRGAVPIILATFPVMAAARGSEETFHLVFFIVLVNAIVPGATIKWVTHKLGLMSNEPPPPQALLEVTSMSKLDGRVLAFFVDKASAASGVAIRDLPFPHGSSVMVIVRGGSLLAPRGDVELAPHDHLYVVTTPADEPLVRLMFGQQEEIG